MPRDYNKQRPCQHCGKMYHVHSGIATRHENRCVKGVLKSVDSNRIAFTSELSDNQGSFLYSRPMKRRNINDENQQITSFKKDTPEFQDKETWDDESDIDVSESSITSILSNEIEDSQFLFENNNEVDEDANVSNKFGPLPTEIIHLLNFLVESHISQRLMSSLFKIVSSFRSIPSINNPVVNECLSSKPVTLINELKEQTKFNITTKSFQINNDLSVQAMRIDAIEVIKDILKQPISFKNMELRGHVKTRVLDGNAERIYSSIMSSDDAINFQVSTITIIETSH